MEMQMSSYREGRIDVPDMSADVLTLFKHQNAPLWDKLKTLTTERDYKWAKLEVLPKGSPITDIVETGIASAPLAPDCVGALQRELRRHATSGSIRLFVMIDGANSLYGKVILTNDKHKAIGPKPQDVTLVHNTRKFLRHDWTNGVCVLIADKAELSDARDDLTVPIDSPLDLFGVEGFHAIDPFIPIETKLYNLEEATSMHDYYKDVGWLTTEAARTDEARTQITYLSAFNPYNFERICSFN